MNTESNRDYPYTITQACRDGSPVHATQARYSPRRVRAGDYFILIERTSHGTRMWSRRNDVLEFDLPRSILRLLGAPSTS